MPLGYDLKSLLFLSDESEDSVHLSSRSDAKVPNFRRTERGLCSCKKKNKKRAPFRCGKCLDKRQPLFGACLLKCLVGLVLLYFPTSRGLPEPPSRHKESSCVIPKTELTFRCVLSLLQQSPCLEEQPACHQNRLQNGAASPF